MVAIGERWKFDSAQVDFTIVSLDEEWAYYRMNWNEVKRQSWLNNPVIEYYINGYGGSYTKTRYHDPDQICKVRLSSFENGNVVRSE